MLITDYFPVGTKLIIEVVAANGCGDCVFADIDCCCIPNFCSSEAREDNTKVMFKLVEVKEP